MQPGQSPEQQQRAVTPPDHSDSTSNSNPVSESDSEEVESTQGTAHFHLVPYQPKNSFFPRVVDCSNKRSFQRSWFDKWPWLEWDDEKKCAFCHPCRMAVILRFSLSKKAETAFSSDGFRAWKNATSSFRKHESSQSHKEVVVKWTHYTKSQPVVVQLSQQLQADQARARNCLFKIVSTLKFLARQGLAMRGHEEAEGNFLQMLQVRSEDCPDLVNWLQKRGNWTSHEIQNEIIEIMAHSVLRKMLIL